MKRLIRLVPLVSMVALAFVMACGGEPEAPAPAQPTTASAQPTAPSQPEPAQPAAEPTSAPAPAPSGNAPAPSNPAGTITIGRPTLDCNPSTGSVYCGQYQADVWGAGEDLFTWRRNDDGTVDYASPQLAVSWDLADDFLSVVVETRQGVQFHKDMGEMTAEDVAWSYNQVNPLLTPNSIAPSASYFSTLFGDNPAEALDANHVQYTFAVVDSHWHTYMMNENGYVGMIVHSKKAWDEQGEAWSRDNFVGTGPYGVETWVRDDRAVFIKSSNHWRVDPVVERVIIQAMPEDSTRVAALQTGELDATVLAIKSVPGLLEQGFQSITTGNAQTAGMIFNGNYWEREHAGTGEPLNMESSGVYVNDLQWLGNPYVFSDSNDPEALACPDGTTYETVVQQDMGCGDMEQARLVRWAVASAIDREAINNELMGGLGWPLHLVYVDTNDPNWQARWEHTFDPAMAEQMLDQAGYPEDGGVRFDMPIFVQTGLYGGLGEEMGDAVSGMMSNIGIRSEILKYPYAVFRPGLVDRSATVPRIQQGDDGQAIFPFDWPKGIEQSSLSRGGYCFCFETPKVSEVYMAVSKEPDLQRRIALNTEMYDYLHYWGLQPGIVAIPDLTVVNRNSIQEWNIEPSPHGFNNFANIVPAAR